jgi:hypothetical protein
MQSLVTGSGCYTGMLIKGYIKSIAHRNESSVMNEKKETLIVLKKGQVIKSFRGLKQRRFRLMIERVQ